MCAPASGCCRRCRRCGPSSTGRWALATPSPDRSTALFLLAEHLRRVAGRRSRHRRVAHSTTRLRREGDPGSGSPHLRGTTRHRIRAAVHRGSTTVDRRTGRHGARTQLARTQTAGRRNCDASARSCWRSPCPAFPTSTRAPNCSTTASSTRTTAGRWTTGADATRSRPAATPRCAWSTAALRLRRARPDTLPSRRLHPSARQGRAAEHLVAFLRGDDVLVAVSRHTFGCARPAGATRF